MKRWSFLISLFKAVVVVAVVLWLYSWWKGTPMLRFFQKEEHMEHTATVLRGVENTHRWVFLTVEDEEAVVRDHVGYNGKVAKIFPSFYELGIDLKNSPDWYEIQERDGVKTAKLTLPAITLLNDNGVNAAKVINVYGNADRSEMMQMLMEAQNSLKARALSTANILQAKSNAQTFFTRLFTSLGCTSVEITWER